MRNRYILAAACLALLAGCDNKKPVIQGYVEADMVYVSPALGGRLVDVHVKRGDRVKAGAPLFDQDNVEQRAELSQANALLLKARADLADLLKGERPEELAVLRAKIATLESVCALARVEHERNVRLRASDVVAVKDFDNTRLLLARHLLELEEARRNLAVAVLPAREDQVNSAREAVKAAGDAVAAAQWRLEQRSVAAAEDALVFDVLSRPSEYAAPGTPVLALIPPRNMRVRFFVPYALATTIHPGDPVTFLAHGRHRATVGYISPKPEYTPPVIYSENNTEKLVFMIEADVAAEDAPKVNPGLPVVVELGK